MDSITSRAIAKREQVSAEMNACKRQLDALQLRVRELQSQMKLLVELIGEDAEDVGDGVAASVDHAVIDGPRPVDAILQYLAEHPAGTNGKDIADTLAGKIATKSGNPRNIIHNTLHNLLKRSKIRKDDTSGLFFPVASTARGNLAELDI